MAEDKCEHANCQCETTHPDAVTVKGHAFCSDGCSRGEGCDHPDCDCSERTA